MLITPFITISAGTVQQLTQATAKSLTPAVAAQIQLFRQQALKHQQQQQLRAQQQRLQGVAVTGVSVSTVASCFA